MKFNRKGIVFLALWLALPVAAYAAEYKIDTGHSAVSFKVRHLFSKVQGNFNTFSGQFSYEPNQPESWKAEAVIDAVSIDTNQEKRDEHLRGKDFFEVETYPQITFKSTGVHEAAGNTAKLDGVLTMHGVEKPVVLDVEILGEDKDPWGNVRIGITATTKINRKDFGIIWNQVLDSGKGMIGDEIEITLEVEGLRA